MGIILPIILIAILSFVAFALRKAENQDTEEKRMQKQKAEKLEQAINQKLDRQAGQTIAHREMERIISENNSNIDRSVNRLSISAIRRMREYIFNLPDKDLSGESRSAIINRTFAIAAAAKYFEGIENGLSSALDAQRYFDAREYSLFLKQLDPSCKRFCDTYMKLDEICDFLNSPVPLVDDRVYGVVPKEFAETIEREYSPEHIYNRHRPGINLWGETLAEPFDAARYFSTVHNIPRQNQYGKPVINRLASLIYVQGRYNELLFDEYGESSDSIDASLQQVIDDGNIYTLFKLASIACAGGNRSVELTVLRKLDSLIELPDQHKKRLYV